MSWWEWYCSMWTGDGLRCDLSWWVLRATLSPRWLSRGARILVIDDNPGDLTELLVYRGYDAIGVNVLQRRVVTARHATNVPVWFADQELILPEHYFDLVIARDLEAFEHDLATAAVRATSANLLSSVKPGGKLTLLVRQKPTWQDRPGGHLRSCFARHFRQFALKCESKFLGDEWHRWRTWNWMLGDQPRWGHLIVSAPVPFNPLTRIQWHEMASSDDEAIVPACCAWVRRQSVSPPMKPVSQREAEPILN